MAITDDGCFGSDKRGERPRRRRQSAGMEQRGGNGAWHGFRLCSKEGLGVRVDHGTDPLSDAGSSLAAADLRLAELRSVSEIPGTPGFPRLLAGKTRWPPPLGDRGAFPAD